MVSASSRNWRRVSRSTNTTVPNNTPTPAVIPIASAPQNVTRIMLGMTLAPPARAAKSRSGLYNGLDERLDERIHTPREGGLCGPVILAGPTCDSADILYRRHPYDLPLDLAIGDPLDFLSGGAYTGSVAAVAFNGFTPIRSYFV